jgi:hypothetical protein
MVPLSSVESQDYFINLGHSKSCHTNLMSEYEYGLAKDVIVEDSNQTGTQKQQQQQQEQQQQQQLQQHSQQKIQETGVSLDLSTPAAGNMFGGEKKGSFNFSFQNNNVIGNAKMNEKPAEGKVYEGWFEDKGDASGYTLSVGKFNKDENTLALNQTMVNPYTYTVFFVTAEPVDDPDPKPADIVVGAKLPIPFGQ